MPIKKMTTIDFMQIKIDKSFTKGGHGAIHKVTDDIVCKTFSHEKNADVSSYFLREIGAIQRLKDSYVHIIKPLGFKMDEKQSYIYLPYYKQDLHRFSRSYPGSCYYHTRRIAYQLLENIYTAHQNLIWHRDVTSYNVLLDHNHNAILCDWSISKFAHCFHVDYMTAPLMPETFRAPEIYARDYDERIDIWGAGMTILDFYTKKYFVDGSKEERYDQMKAIAKYIDEHIENDDLADLLKRMLTFDKEKRISIVDALNHRYFDEIRKSTFAPLDPTSHLIAKCKNEFDVSRLKKYEAKRFAVLYGIKRTLVIDYQTLFLAMYYLDVILSGEATIKEKDIRPIATACCLVADKVAFTFYHPPKSYSAIYNGNDLLEWERWVIMQLGGDVYKMTEFFFMQLFYDGDHTQSLANTLAHFVFEIKYRKYKPYEVALAYLYTMKKINKEILDKYDVNPKLLFL